MTPRHCHSVDNPESSLYSGCCARCTDIARAAAVEHPGFSLPVQIGGEHSEQSEAVGRCSRYVDRKRAKQAGGSNYRSSVDEVAVLGLSPYRNLVPETLVETTVSDVSPSLLFSATAGQGLTPARSGLACFPLKTGQAVFGLETVLTLG